MIHLLRRCSPQPAFRVHFSFAADCAALAQPWLLAETLRFLRGGRAWANALTFVPAPGLPEGLALCTVLLLCSCAQALCLGQYKWHSRLAGAMMRDTAASVVVARALLLRCPTPADAALVADLVSVDCGAPGTPSFPSSLPRSTLPVCDHSPQPETARFAHSPTHLPQSASAPTAARSTTSGPPP